MEKLIALLNECMVEDGLPPDWMISGNGVRAKKSYYGEEISEMVVISKKYGFIERLVENDKIDIKALVVKGEMRSGWDFENKKGNEESGEEIWNKYYSELCLMILSISDTPIEDLISYLHE